MRLAVTAGRWSDLSNTDGGNTERRDERVHLQGARLMKPFNAPITIR